MSFKKLSLLVPVLMLIFGSLSIFSVESYTSNIQSLVLDDFELAQDGKPVRSWIVIPDRFGREGNVDSGNSLQDLRWVKAWPEAYFGKEVPEKNRGEFFFGPAENDAAKTRYTDVSGTCLSLKVAFNRQGYNSVELYPLGQVDGKWVKQPAPFKGKVKQVDMWIWGANYNYNVEMVLMDYRGAEHRIDVGNIRHIGWKNFVIPIPKYIPQEVHYIPGLKELSLVKLIIWTTPNEKVTGAYIYIDHIKYLTDVFSELYDGYQLGDKTKVKELWDKGAQPPKESDIVQ